MPNYLYDKQREEGAAQIVSRLREFANDAGVVVEFSEWNGGGQLVGRQDHQLVTMGRGKTVPAKFSDEQLADYPGRAGTERTDAMLREIVRCLK